ncbi:transcription elongation factor GreA [Cohnella candidum]|uniref:Transcription elongation factor GreA n=1 Tax=Cohnella candidum TaxID=2674991 RepID=A0A3G3JZ13_9BACL|nr:transcription elongation factor GreA [Cohnella candidum]AYQ73392.1 transcription elongation factor GreA [Cohnella candidum]
MSNEEVILTPEGLQKLKEELHELKTVKRRELAERLKVAISYGDLKENSEYHSAKDDQAFMETRILQLERMLKVAQVVDPGSARADKINVGSVAVLYDVEFEETVEYRIVGTAEANAAENRISYMSPLGTQLMGRKVGDVIEVNAPMGTIQYKLLEIK